MSNDPRAWRDVEPTTVGVAARALAERRRARERAVNDGGGPGQKFVAALAVTPTVQLALAAARDGVEEGADATPCPYTSKPRPKPPPAPTP